MIFEVTEEFFETVIKKFPYIRLNETIFFNIIETYYSKNGVKEEPWTNPKDSIIHRITAELQPVERLDFEIDNKKFLEFCSKFFDKKVVKVFENRQDYLLTGTKDNLQYSEISNWKALKTLLEKTNLSSYLTLDRLLMRIPLGANNINIIKIEGLENIFVEVTNLENNYQSIERVCKDLELKNGYDTNWAQLTLNRLNVEAS